MKKTIIIPVIAIIIVLAIYALSISPNSLNNGSKEGMVESTLEDSGVETEQESSPQGRNLSIELEEKMGLSTP